VVLAGQVPLSVQDVQQFCDGRLARYKFPRHLVILDELPRTATGKVAVGQLRGAASK
jgi:fatty-acyl-CoA synthase